MANITPMMQQYLKIKSEYDDCLLFLDLEISMKCFDDAKEASRVLEITLTKRDAKKKILFRCVAYHIILLIITLKH